LWRCSSVHRHQCRQPRLGTGVVEVCSAERHQPRQPWGGTEVVEVGACADVGGRIHEQATAALRERSPERLKAIRDLLTDEEYADLRRDDRDVMMAPRSRLRRADRRRRAKLRGGRGALFARQREALKVWLDED
jgi:hypothetical protein